MWKSANAEVNEKVQQNVYSSSKLEKGGERAKGEDYVLHVCIAKRGKKGINLILEQKIIERFRF